MPKDTLLAVDLPLVGKQKPFVREYPIDHNGTKAAIRSTYSPHTATEMAYENLRKPHIAKAIKQREDALAEKADLTNETVINGLLKEALNAKSDSARVSAYGLLGKYLGMFIERRENVNINLSRPLEGTPLTHLDLAIRLIHTGASQDRIDKLIQDLEGESGDG